MQRERTFIFGFFYGLWHFAAVPPGKKRPPHYNTNKGWQWSPAGYFHQSFVNYLKKGRDAFEK